jgi:nucleoside-triphosphatase THEP1
MARKLASASGKTYVVFKGRKTGLFDTWGECQSQVLGFPKNKLKSYPTRADAEQAWEESKIAPVDDKSKQDSCSFPSHRRTNKRPVHNVIDLTEFGDEDPQVFKISRMESESHLVGSSRAQSGPSPEPVQTGEAIELTSAQQSVVDLAVAGYNIFLTGAAGSGKSVTLRRITECLKIKAKDFKISVVAPTGIAALAVNGKTTYSFAGWKTDSFRHPMEKLLSTVTEKRTITLTELDCLIIEEVSMVENQFLERLNRLLQAVMNNNEPFGGKQVILVGDFHQLPPVKPFERCLECGNPMTRSGISPEYIYVCKTTECASQGEMFKDSEKWAFK